LIVFKWWHSSSRLVLRGLISLKFNTDVWQKLSPGNAVKAFIENPIFVDSSCRHLSQLADCVAYCIRRYYRSAEADPRERETFFRIIESKLLKNGNKSAGYGLKIFPK